MQGATQVSSNGSRAMRTAAGGAGIPFALGSSDVINSQLLAISRREAWAPVAWGPVPGQAGAFSPVPTVPPAVSTSTFGVMGSQGPGYTAGLGGAAGSDITGGGMNLQAAAAAGQYPFNFKLSPLPWAIIFLLVGLVGLRLVHWR